MLDFVMGNLSIFMAIGMLWVGILVGVLVSQPSKDQVVKIQGEGNRGVLYNVKEYSEFMLYADGFSEFPPAKFLIWAQPIFATGVGYLGRVFKRNLWLARDGVVTTQMMNDDKLEDVPAHRYVETVFGEHYKQVPQNIRNELESGKVTVTVELEKNPVIPEELKELTTSNASAEDDRNFLSVLGDEVAKAAGQNVYLMGGMLGAGGFVAVLILLFTGHIC